MPFTSGIRHSARCMVNVCGNTRSQTLQNSIAELSTQLHKNVWPAELGNMWRIFSPTVET